MIIVPTSDHPFYRWQVLVQIVALGDLGLLDDTQWIFYCNKQPSSHLQKLSKSGLINMTVWPDWARDRSYNGAMKPWLVGKWLLYNPDHIHDNNLVIDPDVILTRKPDLIPIPGILHGTDTDSYTGPAYLKSKNAWRSLCIMFGVDEKEASIYPGIGAQIAFTNINGSWWESVALDSIKAYKKLYRIKSPDKNNVQVWCAEMYATQMSAIRSGLEPRLEPSMSMVWANGPIADWETNLFFHDAGVPKPKPGVFCKAQYQNGPWGKQIDVDPNLACYKYVELIKRTELELSGLLS